MGDTGIGEKIFHLAQTGDWQKSRASGVYQPPSLAHDGFLHASLPHQVMAVANSVFRGRKDIILLAIDPKKLTSEVKNEDLRRSGSPYPHIYGPINRDAVIASYPFEPKADGTFTWPKGLGDEPRKVPKKERKT